MVGSDHNTAAAGVRTKDEKQECPHEYSQWQIFTENGWADNNDIAIVCESAPTIGPSSVPTWDQPTLMPSIAPTGTFN